MKRECEWDRERPLTPSSPHIVSKFFDKCDIEEKAIFEAVENDNFFGLLAVDLKSPMEVIEKFEKIKFPVIFKHVNIGKEHVEEFMSDLLKKKGVDLSKKNLERQLGLGESRFISTTDSDLQYTMLITI